MFHSKVLPLSLSLSSLLYSLLLYSLALILEHTTLFNAETVTTLIAQLKHALVCPLIFVTLYSDRYNDRLPEMLATLFARFGAFISCFRSTNNKETCQASLLC